ncbi:sulfatase [Haloferula sp. A504]|uniref:sulfatase n=1 Tax=Haloferula sp. A504 TaxID=3373601 RepID=UPI0031C2072B|nr:sulfatase [Verrucomicrobiaceae bacterium E54]
MRRSTIIQTLCVMLLASPAAAVPARPNILFIMSDDHSYQAMGCYGSRLAPLNPTPALDKLAGEGMVFENVFCSNSICTPSRASVMTGQYSHVNGVRDLYDRLPGRRHELSKRMSEAGYQTAVIGKWHLKDSPEFFDYFAVIAGQGTYMNPLLHVSEGGRKRRVRFDSTMTREIEVIETKGHSSDVLTDMSLDWLDRRDPHRPFFLMHHFKAPHDMFVYAPRYEGYLEDATIPEPPNLHDQPGPDFGSVATRGDNDSLVGVIGSTVSPQKTKRNLARYYRQKIRTLTGRDDLTDRELTSWTYQLYLKEYLRCVKGIDDNLQRLLDYLERESLMDNTVILYTSDQGMMLGEHDYIDKRWMLEESIRLPLIIRAPGMKPGSRCDWLLNNVDFAPTLLEAAGAKVPEDMQGRSFLKALDGDEAPADWRQAIYYRYWMHMAHGHNNPAHFGIRTKRHKLIFYYGKDYTGIHAGKPVEGKDGNRFWKDTPAGWELYDLVGDPHEMHNRYDDPEYAGVVARLKAELKRLRKDLGDTDADQEGIREVIENNWER